MRDTICEIRIGGSLVVRQASFEEKTILARMAIRVWENDDVAELEEEFETFITGDDSACYLKYADGRPVGFAQCGLRRDYVEGTQTSPVGYLEGIYVAEGYRGHGYARELLTACEDWAKGKGCSEFASDCILSNEDSLRFHLAVGFIEANRIICFTKKLSK